MTKWIGATADSSFLRLLISNKRKEIAASKDRIIRNEEFIKEAEAELKSRGEDVNG